MFMNECIDSTMGCIHVCFDVLLASDDPSHVCFAVLLASDDPRTSWSFQCGTLVVRDICQARSSP
jgi:hypothetical protein